MCGRYTLTKVPKAELNRVGITDPPDIEPRYNISPGQLIPAVVNDPEINGRRRIRALEWGLIPPWTKEKAKARRLINARAETIDSKPSFRGAARHSRCLVPANGYYEWKRSTGEAKQPYYFHLTDHRLFFLAGIWEMWDGPNGEAIDSCAILTTRPNSKVKQIHDRMPVILKGDESLQWMDARIQRVSELTNLFNPCSAEDITLYPVSRRVNSPTNDDPSCLAPLDSKSSETPTLGL